MYCPECGLKNLDDSKFCASCGENLEKEGKYKKFDRYSYYAPFIILPLLIGIFYISNRLGLNLSQMLLVIVIISGLFMYLMFQLFRGQSSRYCPICESTNFNEHFCIKCGYNLDNVLGYFKTGKYDIEMNKKHINIYKKFRYQGPRPLRPGWHSHGRNPPQTFTLDKIQNLQLSSCKTKLSSKPCLKFDYADEECKFYLAHKDGGKCMVNVEINRKIEKELEKVLSLEIFR